ncbi:hypothetical protein M8C21_009183 [Ambrosia artemisiifolia]|uniref:Uncharacterized protein n=1 Tax=Ambrosia artemisiifolia TaxID=4212 RepID=A0AAD5G945_AMBAR|nr:hypothetical protein M8C21_009183 [Ambrosia artemisiifolia]
MELEDMIKESKPIRLISNLTRLYPFKEGSYSTMERVWFYEAQIFTDSQFDFLRYLCLLVNIGPPLKLQFDNSWQNQSFKVWIIKDGEEWSRPSDRKFVSETESNDKSLDIKSAQSVAPDTGVIKDGPRVGMATVQYVGRNLDCLGRMSSRSEVGSDQNGSTGKWVRLDPRVVLNESKVDRVSWRNVAR